MKFKLVPNDHVKQFEDAGWHKAAAPFCLSERSTLMEWAGEGEPVVPYTPPSSGRRFWRRDGRNSYGAGA